MTKVITYGTYDMLHYGHIKLLERAKALGGYLIVGVTADDFDKTRGKINIKQSLMERIEAVRETGLADEIIIEEYEGQKIDDIKRYNIDVFTVGSDWTGKFDYLKEYCDVVYLKRTEGVSSTEIRSQKREIRIGLVGELENIRKFYNECSYVNGMIVTAICSIEMQKFDDHDMMAKCFFSSEYEQIMEYVDAVYIVSSPNYHYEQIKCALINKKHVLCESPISLQKKQCEDLFSLAKEQGCVLMEAIKTAYSTAYYRLLLLAKSGRIGEIVSVDATCTSLKKIEKKINNDAGTEWNSILAWGPTALLPVFQLLGTEYKNKSIISKFSDNNTNFDVFSKIDFVFPNAVATIKVGKGVKAEGELIVAGTKGYIYVPAPWWKTDYFELRYENVEDNKRYFYQLDGEGIRYEIVAFSKAIETGSDMSYIGKSISAEISYIAEEFISGNIVKI